MGCTGPALSKGTAAESKQGREGRGMFAAVFCLEPGCSRGLSAAAPPDSHRKEGIILHRDTDPEGRSSSSEREELGPGGMEPQGG